MSGKLNVDNSGTIWSIHTTDVVVVTVVSNLINA